MGKIGTRVPVPSGNVVYVTLGSIYLSVRQITLANLDRLDSLVGCRPILL